MAPARSAAKKKGPRCPICEAPTDKAYRPFCSKRCADVDLSRWLNGNYAIAVTEDDDEDGTQIASTDQAAPEDTDAEPTRH